MTVHRHAPGMDERTEHQSLHVFAAIEAFFRTHLA